MLRLAVVHSGVHHPFDLKEVILLVTGMCVVAALSRLWTMVPQAWLGERNVVGSLRSFLKPSQFASESFQYGIALVGSCIDEFMIIGK